MKLTSRERFFRAVNRKAIDRVPIDFGGAEGPSSVSSSIIDAPPYGYRALCEYLGITDYPSPETSAVLNSVLNVDERILEKFGSDFRDVPPSKELLASEVLPSGYIRGIHGTLMKPGYDTGGFGWVSDSMAPFRYGKTIRDVDEYPHWTRLDVPKLERIADEYYRSAKKLHGNTDYVVTAGGCAAFTMPPFYWAICGFNKFFLDIRRNPEFYHAVCERFTDYEVERRKILLNAQGDYVDRVWVGDDMGTQTGGFLSVKDFREFVLPYWEKVVKTTKKYAPKAKVIIHCCGSVHSYVKDMASIGIDILSGLQPQAANMEAERLKKDFGDIISFLGGIDVQRILPFGTPHEVREWTKRYIRTLAPGYIAAASHNIGPEVPPQNIVAAFETAKEYVPWQ